MALGGQKELLWDPRTFVGSEFCEGWVLQEVFCRKCSTGRGSRKESSRRRGSFLKELFQNPILGTGPSLGQVPVFLPPFFCHFSNFGRKTPRIPRHHSELRGLFLRRRVGRRQAEAFYSESPVVHCWARQRPSHGLGVQGSAAAAELPAGPSQKNPRISKIQFWGPVRHLARSQSFCPHFGIFLNFGPKPPESPGITRNCEAYF